MRTPKRIAIRTLLAVLIFASFAATAARADALDGEVAGDIARELSGNSVVQIVGALSGG